MSSWIRLLLGSSLLGASLVAVQAAERSSISETPDAKIAVVPEPTESPRYLKDEVKVTQGSIALGGRPFGYQAEVGILVVHVKDPMDDDAPPLREDKSVPPPPQPPPAKRGRKSKAERQREAMEKAREADAAAAERRKATPFVCHHPGCTARFRQLEHLKVHFHTHEGIKPFKCDFEGCDKTFSQKGNLKVQNVWGVELMVGASKETYGRKAVCLS